MSDALPTRQILTDSSGKPTHVVLTIEEYERIVDLVQAAIDIQEVERRLESAEFMPLEDVKATLF